MANNRFAPKDGSFGVELVMTGFTSFGTVTLTANTTNSFYIQPPPRPCRLRSVTANQGTVVVDSDGTVLATAKKVTAGVVGASQTSALDLEGATAKVAQAFAVTAAEADRRFNSAGTAGELLVIEVVNNSAAIDTQPVGVSFAAEWEILR